MKGQFILWAILMFGVWSYVACSQVKFSSTATCDGVTNAQCTVGPDGVRSFSGTETVKGGKVDVLIVDDNSASMSFEQARLGERFDNFMTLLDGKSVDYRIAITTTDISSASNVARTINQSGALQDGRLITMNGGYKFLTPSIGTAQSRNSVFNSTIKRPETLVCEKFIIDWVDSGKSMVGAEYNDGYIANCPSADERGLFAASLVVKNNPDQFIRSEADLAIIILSDEDVRSQLYWDKTPGFDLDTKDTAKGAVALIKAAYANKKFAIHSIITKSAACLSVQSSQTRGLVSGSYGWEYNNASQLTGGVSGDICANDYTSQLKDIFNNITANIVDKISLQCSNPQDLQVDAQGNSYRVEGNQIIFARKLPIGAQVNYSYKCTSAVN